MLGCACSAGRARRRVLGGACSSALHSAALHSAALHCSDEVAVWGCGKALHLLGISRCGDAARRSISLVSAIIYDRRGGAALQCRHAAPSNYSNYSSYWGARCGRASLSFDGRDCRSFSAATLCLVGARRRPFGLRTTRTHTAGGEATRAAPPAGLNSCMMEGVGRYPLGGGACVSPPHSVHIYGETAVFRRECSGEC